MNTHIYKRSIIAKIYLATKLLFSKEKKKRKVKREAHREELSDAEGTCDSPLLIYMSSWERDAIEYLRRTKQPAPLSMLLLPLFPILPPPFHYLQWSSPRSSSS